ncbi:MAG: phospholipase D-like domain-containing protein [Candidatus Helarchaeota archaeon]
MFIIKDFFRNFYYKIKKFFLYFYRKIKNKLYNPEINSKVEPINPIQAIKIPDEKIKIEPEKDLIIGSDINDKQVFRPSVYIGTKQWELFNSIISMAKKEIKIITNSISSQALRVICSNKDPNVIVKIITGRGRGYKEIFNLIGSNNIKRCRYLHAKFCIIDNELIIIGSSNITKGSLGSKGITGNLEVDLLTNDKKIINAANYLFNIIWDEDNNIDPLKNDSNFISSAYGIPLQLKNLIKKAEKEITIIIPPFFPISTDCKSIPKYIRDLNPKIKLRIITSHRVPVQYLDGLRELQELDNTEVLLVSNRIHAKVYLFDESIAIVSSVNLTFNSWITSLESGVIIKNKKYIEIIKNQIEKLEKNIIPLHPIFKKDGEGEIGSSVDDILQKIHIHFDFEGKELIHELKRTLTLNNVDRVLKKKITTLNTDLPKSKRKLSKTFLGPKKVEILPNLFKQLPLDMYEKEKLVNERESLLNKMLDEKENNYKLELKKKIAVINLKLCKLKKPEELEENYKIILRQALLEYVLSCPYNDRDKVIWYFSDFETEYEVLLDLNILFEVFTLSFYTKNRINTAGFVFKKFSLLNKKFKKLFINSIVGLFKNMILGMGSSGIEIKNREEFQSISDEFSDSFGIPAPTPKEILDYIFANKRAISRIVSNNHYYNRLKDIFYNNITEIENFFQPKRRKLMKERLKKAIRYLIKAEKYLNNDFYLECYQFSKKSIWYMLFAYLSFIGKFPASKSEQSIKRMYEIAFGEEFQETLLLNIHINELQMQVIREIAQNAFRIAKRIYKKIKYETNIIANSK